MDLPSADRRALTAALLAVLLGALDLTVIATILPGMVTDLRINAADVDRYVWIVNSYLLAYIVAIPVVGRLSDIVGRTRAFQATLALLLVG
jgi:MFS family permease